MQKYLIVLCILLLSSNMSFGDYAKDDIGTCTAQFLKLGVGARPSGMGDAFTAIADDATAVYWNPSGLCQLEKRSVSLMHAVWFEDISFNWLCYAQPLKTGVLGLGIQYLSYGDIKEIDEAGNEGSCFNPNDMMLTVSYAKDIYDLFLGMSVKYISSEIKERASAFAIDIGAMYEAIYNKLYFGCTVNNIGTQMSFVDEKESLPMSIRVGSAYNIKDNWITSLDVSIPKDSQLSVGLGNEYTYKINNSMNVVGRLGYNTTTSDIDGFKGLSVGIGASFNQYCLDYAFVPFGDMGDTHRISLNIKF